jgi:glycerol-3-phosphate acyltransferase PlsY
MPWMEQLEAANWGQAGGIALGAYSLGCLATGYYLVRWRTGLDLRQSGSGSLGARNTGRILGAAGFWAALTGDVAKGVLAVWVARHFTKDLHLVALAMLAVVAGHVWPAQLRFRGGKGIATSLGALMIYNFQVVLAFGVLFALGLAMFRKMVVAGLLAFACLPLLSVCWRTDAGARADGARTWALSTLAAIVLVAHRKNLMAEASRFLERRNIHPKPDPPES